jgi:hypothetical protein
MPINSLKNPPQLSMAQLAGIMVAALNLVAEGNMENAQG